MKKFRPHPLELWLVEKDLSIPAFARASGVAFRILYDHFSGDANPKLSTLLAIEVATKKEITVQKQANWFKRIWK